MNFINGTALAVLQDKYLSRYLRDCKFSTKEIDDMKSNMWVASAFKLAPGNLVIRQYALIDLMTKCPRHSSLILNLIETLTYKSKYLKLWAEGYSYYCYTRDVLDEWCKLFPLSARDYGINDAITKIDNGFWLTAYERNDVLYPAPFGDLRDEPLRRWLQNKRTMVSLIVENVSFYYDKDNRIFIYSVSGKPLGLNTHVPKDTHCVRIVNGIPEGFKFYEGYDKKYKNKLEEFKDTFNIERVMSI